MKHLNFVFFVVFVLFYSVCIGNQNQSVTGTKMEDCQSVMKNAINHCLNEKMSSQSEPITKESCCADINFVSCFKSKMPNDGYCSKISKIVTDPVDEIIENNCTKFSACNGSSTNANLILVLIACIAFATFLQFFLIKMLLLK